MDQKPKTLKKVIRLFPKKDGEETSLDQDMGVDEFKFHRTVEALAALLTAGDVLVENTSALLQKSGSNEEKEAWQVFEREWEKIAELFAIFWETP